MRSSFLRTVAAGIGLAAVLATLVWVVARVTGDDLRVTAFAQDSPEKMPIFLPAVVTLMYGTVGAVVVLLLRRRAAGRTIFLVLSVVVLIFAGVQSFAATDSSGTAIWLNVMHVVAAAAIVPAFLRLFARSV
jgi:hypothetical protein